MQPTSNQKSDTDIERNADCEVVYMDKTCCAANGKTNDKAANDYFVFINKNKAMEACPYKIDLEAYCITMIEEEPVMNTTDILTQPITRFESYNLPRVEIANNFANNYGDSYDGYHYSTFERNNVNYYVLDTSVLLTHTEFDDITGEKVYLGSIASPFEPANHGTHVAGTMVGRTAGFNRDPSVNLYSYGCCYSTSNSCSWSAITAGLQTIMEHCEAATDRTCVINFSVGGGRSDRYDPYFAALGDAIFVTSAGNGDQDACNQSPAEHPDVISVAAYDWDDIRSSFSNYGSCVDAYAPGSYIRSSIASSTTSYSNYYGTSMASPAIAGIVGILRSYNPSLTLQELKNILSCEEYGFLIEDNLTPNVQYGFGVAFGDYYHIAQNPNECVSLSTSNIFNIDFGDTVSTTISISGEEILYRVPITNGPTDIAFIAATSGTDLTFYDVNYNSIESSTDLLQLTNIANGAYWLGVSSDSTGTFSVQMIQNVVPTTMAPTAQPTTTAPTTTPTTTAPTTRPTTSSPTTKSPTNSPVTKVPTSSPITQAPTTTTEACFPRRSDCTQTSQCCDDYVCRRNRRGRGRLRCARAIFNSNAASANAEMNDKSSHTQTHSVGSESEDKMSKDVIILGVFIVIFGLFIIIVIGVCISVCKKKRQSKRRIDAEIKSMSEIVQTEINKIPNIIKVDGDTISGVTETNNAEQESV